MKVILCFIVINSSLMDFLAITLQQELFPQYKILLAMNTQTLVHWLMQSNNHQSTQPLKAAV